MLSARAYSFRQNARLAISLSWIGGYTNVIMLQACGSLVSHMTGNVTWFGRDAVAGDFSKAVYFAFLLLTFLSGAVISTLLTESARRRSKQSKYILPLALECVLLVFLGWSLRGHAHVDPSDTVMLYTLTGIAALAMGLQNATITKISGAIVRTTHLTGVITDLGIEGVQLFFWYLDRIRGGRWARTGRVLKVSQRHPTALRVLLLASIWGSFLFGVVVGALAFHHWHARALLAPVLFLCWIIFVDWRTPIADVKELDLLSDPELAAHGIVKALLPPELGIYRLALPHGSASHRAPNFQLWVDHLPAHWRVVILAVSPLTQFSTNTGMDLQHAIEKLHATRRRLIISGITPRQFKVMQSQGIMSMLDSDNLCPDLEFAIARGVTLVEELKTEQAPAWSPSL